MVLKFGLIEVRTKTIFIPLLTLVRREFQLTKDVSIVQIHNIASIIAVYEQQKDKNLCILLFC